MPNQLANESSPYLLQHASNPVNWYAWGSEALERARSEDKPIFLSIGYSACHWCHVMEHESFENEAIARTLNDHFVSIKVDREERPDLDQIYMNAVQMISGRGGWPMSVFLTPGGKPFFGGTYWPPSERMGMPGFDQVLSSIIDAWNARREQADEQAEMLVKRLGEVGMIAGSGEEASLELLWDAAAELRRSADRERGGFGNAPKFPHSMALQLLMRVARRRPGDDLLELVKLNLDRMAHGGIYDHLAGGFARYSVDADWLVPHFEKMLYDNALLADAYLDGFLLTGDPEYARVVTETLDYQLTYMTDAGGGFHSTEDADSEGVEGKFYVWTPAEILEVLGDEAGERFCLVYGVSEQGNFEGSSILHLPCTIAEAAHEHGWDEAGLRAELAESRARLLEVRDRRIRPGKDDKVLASWNGLMIHTMARAAGILDDEKYLQAAASAARFAMETMCRQDGRLFHSWRAGEARIDGFLDDYANLVNALVTLYEADFDEDWLDQAVRLGEIIMEQFHDPEEGGFFYTANDHEKLIARNKEIFDNATPSSSSMVGMALLRLGNLSGNTVFLEAAWGVLRQGTGVMQRSAIGGAQLLNLLDMKLGPTPQIVILGDRKDMETAGLLQDLRQRFLPNRVVACAASADEVKSVNLKEIFAGKGQQDGVVTTYFCESFSCRQPVMGRQAFCETLDTMSEGEPGMAEGDVSITA
ncbi:MAG: thioredoxin domain-containing protein, partial [Pirellulaceae bacterium]|nr:thioredoxin domain-containing protein [Pirellulaceae bacterium]